ncbi:MAG: UDP-3-O-(3-hydroxymyristoyl)glucosamine N-acyltransferase [Pseudomonadota bacterium]
MQHPGFFERSGPYALHEIAAYLSVDLADPAPGRRQIFDVQTLGKAGPEDISFFDNWKYLTQLTKSSAGACILNKPDAEHAPSGLAILASATPYETFARVVRLFYPDSHHSKAAGTEAIDVDSLIHPTAQIATNVIIEPGAVIGKEACIGANTTIAAGALVSYRVVVGQDCQIGPGVKLSHAILGDSVIIHSNAAIGQDGFGFAIGAHGHTKVPQIGRVLVGDNVEIGANTSIDRGSIGDTVIGEGTKIDNLVQIAHNVRLGKRCVIVAQSGIAGSAELGDFVVMGAQSGVLGHISIGSGTQIAGLAHVTKDCPENSRLGGSPARPFREWARELAATKRLGQRGSD